MHAGDLETFLTDHDEDILMFDVLPPWEGVRGLVAYRDTWPPFFQWQATGASFDFVELNVTASSDVAFATAQLRCGTDQDFQQNPDLRLRLTVGLLKRDGRWVVVHEHHSFPSADLILCWQALSALKPSPRARSISPQPHRIPSHAAGTERRCRFRTCPALRCFGMGEVAETWGVEAVERRLSVTLPARVRQLYEASNGRYSESGQWWVVWPLARVADDNERAWGDGSLARHLLAFGDDGAGKPFCVSLNSDVDEVLRWNWLDHDVEVDEASMERFIQTWLDDG